MHGLATDWVVAASIYLEVLSVACFDWSLYLL